MRKIDITYSNYKEADALIGKHVLVVGCNVKAYLEQDIINCEGIVTSIRFSTIHPCQLRALAIRLDGKYNSASQKGVFWIVPDNLMILEENDNMDTNCKICKVIDESSGASANAVYYGKLTEGELVVCDFGYGNGKMSVRRVVDIRLPVARCDGTVIGKVDTSEYDNYVVKRKKLKEVEAKMKEMASKVENDLYFKFLAENSKEFANVYNEYKELLK